MPHEVFPLPEITYPLVMGTIGKLLALGDEIEVYCGTYGCHHHAPVNLYHLARKLGRDFEASHWTLKRHFRCSKCRAAGRDDSNVRFIMTGCSWAHSDVDTRLTFKRRS